VTTFSKSSLKFLVFYHGATALVGQGLFIYEDSRSHSVRHITLGRNPHQKWSARRR